MDTQTEQIEKYKKEYFRRQKWRRLQFISMSFCFIVIALCCAGILFCAGQQRVQSEVKVDYARPEYFVTLDSNGGSACAGFKMQLGEYYSVLPTPTRAGYTFDGWSANLFIPATANDYTAVLGTKDSLVVNKNVLKVTSVGSGSPGIVNNKMYNYTTGDLYTVTPGSVAGRVLLRILDSNGAYIDGTEITISGWTWNQYYNCYWSDIGANDTQTFSITDASVKKFQIGVAVYTDAGTVQTWNGLALYKGKYTATSWYITPDTRNTIVGDHTLTAQWTPNNYTVTLYENKNILYGGGLTTEGELNSWANSAASATRTIVTESGLACTKITTSASSGNLIAQILKGEIKSNTQYIYGLKVKLDSSAGYSCVHTPATITVNGTSSWQEVFTNSTLGLNSYYNQGWVDVYDIRTTKVASDYPTDVNVMIYAGSNFTGPIYIRDFTVALATNTTKSVTYNGVLGGVGTLSYDGFTFNGYFTQPVGGVQIYTAGGSPISGVSGYTDASGNWIRSENTKLYGQWTPNTYTYSFDQQSGSGGTSSLSVKFNSRTANITVPTRAGYTFGGYYTATNGGGTQYYNASGVCQRPLTTAGNVTLYAKWTANTYTINLDKQGGTDGTNSTSATYNSKLGTITPPVRTGYTFAGYYTGKNGSGTQLYNASGVGQITWTTVGGTTAYANWTANKYTVTFDKQSGWGGTDSTTATFGSSMDTISIPTRTGYTFAGYYSATGGGGTQYYNGSGTCTRGWDIAQATTLYAYWTPNTITITLNKNGGSGGTDTFYYKYGTNTFYSNSACTTQITTIILPTRTGYTFTHYYGDGTSGGGNEERYIADYGSTSFASDLCTDIYKNATLYAKWTAKTYSVTTGANLSEASVSVSSSGTFASALSISTSASATGYTHSFSSIKIYSGTSTSGTLLATLSSSSTSWTMSGAYYDSIYIYATWSKTAKTYSVKSGVSLTGASVSVASSGTFASALSISTSASATGYTYTFQNIKIYSGTSTSGTLLATLSSSSTSWTMSGAYYDSVYVYASWSRSANTYTLTLDKQGGSGGSGSATATFDSTVPSISVPSKTGYNFAGYYTAINGGGTQYYNASGSGTRAWTADGGQTLYAYWTPKTIKITLDKQGGTGGTDTFYYKYGINKFYSNEGCTSEITAITKPTKTGYTLANFHGDGSCGGNNGEQYVAYGSTNFASDLCTDIYQNATLYASWTANTYTLTINYTVPRCGTCNATGTSTHWSQCSTCGGSGTNGTHQETCGTCDGDKGWYDDCWKCNGSGSITTSTKCTRCKGKGEVSGGTCDDCSGSGTCFGCDGAGCKYCNNTGKCSECNGTGFYPDETCPKCGGSGSISSSETCSRCDGDGHTSSDWDSCSNCSGTGSVSVPTTCSSCNGRGGENVTGTCGTCSGNKTNFSGGTTSVQVTYGQTLPNITIKSFTGYDVTVPNYSSNGTSTATWTTAGDATWNATFSAKSYTMTLSASNGNWSGTATGTTTIAFGTSVSLTFTNTTGYDNKKSNISGYVSASGSSSASVSFVMPAQNISISGSGSGSNNLCLAYNTPILTANGWKMIQDITYADRLIRFNHDTGQIDTAYASWISKAVVSKRVMEVTFSDGETIRFVGDHAVFSLDQNKYVAVTDPAKFYIGTRVLKYIANDCANTSCSTCSTCTCSSGYENCATWGEAVVTGICYIEEETPSYSIITSGMWNCFAGNILTTVPNTIIFQNMYGFKKNLTYASSIRQKVLNGTYDNHLFTEKELKDMGWTDRDIVGFRGREWKILIDNGMLDMDFMINILLNEVANNENERVLPPTNENGEFIYIVTNSEDVTNEHFNPQDFFFEEYTHYILPNIEEEGFVGWLCSSDGKIYKAGDTYKVRTNTHFTAVYST